MEDNIAAINAARALSEKRAGKAAANIHALTTAQQIAERVKDPTAVERALTGKLAAQRDFAAEYKTMFPHGGDRTGQVDISVHLKREGWCLGFGFHEKAVRRWCALLVADQYTAKQKAIVKKCWELAELWQAANYSSESNEWYTPARYIEAVHEVLGGIDLDPASSAQANVAVRAAEIFTKEDDGLARDWHGRVFMNPPYGKTPDHPSLAAAFCNKALAEYECGNVAAGVILVNSLHSQAWQASLYGHIVCLVNHRIHFVSADGEENENPTFQNMFIYLGRDAAKFAMVFSQFGYVLKAYDDSL
jgi:hypothetical protein